MKEKAEKEVKDILSHPEILLVSRWPLTIGRGKWFMLR
jgi:hypothetical protein